MDGNIKDTPPILRMPRAEDAKRYAALPGEIDAAKKAYDVPGQGRRVGLRHLAADPGARGRAHDRR